MKLNRSIIVSIAFAAFAFVVISGCSRMGFDTNQIELDYSGSKKVAVSVLDQREYVSLNEDEGDHPSIIGKKMKSTFGIPAPWPVYTPSEAPVADEMAAGFVNALNAKGYQGSAVIVPAKSAAGDMKKALLAAGADVNIAVMLKEWYGNPNNTLNYELNVMVLDAEGKVVAKLQKKAMDESIGWTWEDQIRVNWKAVLTDILSSEEVSGALK